MTFVRICWQYLCLQYLNCAIEVRSTCKSSRLTSDCDEDEEEEEIEKARSSKEREAFGDEEVECNCYRCWKSAAESGGKRSDDCELSSKCSSSLRK